MHLKLAAAVMAAVISSGAVVVPTAHATTEASSSRSQPAASPIGPKPNRPYNERLGPNYTRAVVLSFDDCTRGFTLAHKRNYVNTVLAAKKKRVALVFFGTGSCTVEWRKRGFDIVGWTRSQGMWYFNHTNTHPQLTKLSYTSVKRQLGAPGVVTTYGRPPYGAINSTVRRAYAAVGMRPWLWTVDTSDWRGKSSGQVASYVVRYSRPGDTVLMHYRWNGFNPTAVNQMIDGLRRRGIQPCKLYPGTTPAKAPTSLPC